MDIQTQFAEAASNKANWEKVRSSTGDKSYTADAFRMLMEKIIEEHKLTPDHIQKEDDWRTALNAVANGIAGVSSDQDASDLEKSSWTYKMQTDDQAILAKAKMANEFASDMLAKSRELASTGDRSVGLSETETEKPVKDYHL